MAEAGLHSTQEVLLYTFLHWREFDGSVRPCRFAVCKNSNIRHHIVLKRVMGGLRVPNDDYYIVLLVSGKDVLEGFRELTKHIFVLARYFQVGVFLTTHDAVPNDDSILSLWQRQEVFVEQIF